MKFVVTKDVFGQVEIKLPIETKLKIKKIFTVGALVAVTTGAIYLKQQSNQNPDQ